MAETTQKCFISQLATLKGEEDVICGLAFYNHDINKVKRMTFVSKFGGRSNRQLLLQEYKVILKTDEIASHEMASNYVLGRVKVCSHVFGSCAAT